MTPAAYKRFDRALERLRDMHICRPWVHRISSPGFDETHAGTSTWTCSTCEPMVAAIFDEAYGSHDTAEVRAPS